MKKKLYSIGQISKILGVSTQALRNYCKIGIVSPEYVNAETGYRYFSYEQIPIIDRTRYLLKCGIRLEEISQILRNDDIDLLVDLLDKKKETVQKEIEQARDKLDIINWYKEYFVREDRSIEEDPLGFGNNIKYIEKRYLIAEPCQPGELYEDIHIRMYCTKNNDQHRDLKILRKFTDIIGYDDFIKEKFIHKYICMNIGGAPEISTKNIMEVPAGHYFCIKGYSRHGGWDSHPVKQFFQNKQLPALVYADEYEISFADPLYPDSIMEFQVLIPETHDHP